MIVTENKDGLLITELNCFDLDLTLHCGQAFRWQKNENGWHHGVAFGKALDIRQTAQGILLSSSSVADFEQIWRRYFDLDRDYAHLCRNFCMDTSLKTAVEQFPGIRILKQEPWEALCSFIISQNNNIPRIKGIIARLCETFGDPLGQDDFAFPSPERIAKLRVEDLAPLRAGFRARYILDAAQKVASGEVMLKKLDNAPLDEARQELTKITGVGAKVAECTLLYGCGRVDAFPVDVWVKRLMEELYPQGLPPCTNGSQGIAQQYLFHWRRQQ
ncbi:MAG TPA: DNA glycosylase [Clostridia bacterium]|nr:DNA glycosylase [Clostridia bacterium]